MAIRKADPAAGNQSSCGYPVTWVSSGSAYGSSLIVSKPELAFNRMVVWQINTFEPYVAHLIIGARWQLVPLAEEDKIQAFFSTFFFDILISARFVGWLERFVMHGKANRFGQETVLAVICVRENIHIEVPSDQDRFGFRYFLPVDEWSDFRKLCQPGLLILFLRLQV